MFDTSIRLAPRALHLLTTFKVCFRCGSGHNRWGRVYQTYDPGRLICFVSSFRFLTYRFSIRKLQFPVFSDFFSIFMFPHLCPRRAFYSLYSAFLHPIESHFVHSLKSCAARVLEEVENYFLGFIEKKEIIAQSLSGTFSSPSPGTWWTESPC